MEVLRSVCVSVRLIVTVDCDKYATDTLECLDGGALVDSILTRRVAAALSLN